MKKLLVLAVLATSLLPAQVLNGRIEVAVTDPSGQAIAGAKVSIRDLRRQSPFGAPGARVLPSRGACGYPPRRRFFVGMRYFE